MNEKELGSLKERAAPGFSWRLCLRGAWFNAVAVACLVGVLVASEPRSPTDDFGPAGMGIIFAAVVVCPWFVFSFLTGAPVVLLVNATSGRPPWFRLWVCFLAATLPSLAVSILWQVTFSGSTTPGQAMVLWGLFPLLSGGCWAIILAGRVLPRGSMRSALEARYRDADV